MVLKTIISKADSLGKIPKLKWDSLSKYAANAGINDLDFDAFETEYNSNPLIQSLVTDYNKDGITLISKKDQAQDSEEVTSEPGEDEFNQVDMMAKRAASKTLK